MPIFAAIPAIAGAVGGGAGAVGAIGSAVGGISGALGGVGGKQEQVSQQLGPMSATERAGGQASLSALDQYGQLTNAGAGVQDVTASTGAQRGLADMFQRYSQQGGNMPTQQDITQQNALAQSLYQGQRQQITGNFAQQQQNFSQQAALQGRNPLDPVFRNKMMQEQTRQLQQLGAEQGSFATQQAMAQPGQRLEFAQQRAGILGGLASQAMSNRQALFNMGNTMQTGGQTFRKDTAGKTTNNNMQAGMSGLAEGAHGGGLIGNAIEQMGQIKNPFVADKQQQNAGAI